MVDDLNEAGVFRIRGLSRAGVDESRNGILFQLPNTWRMEEVECLVRGIGMPQEMGILRVGADGS